MKHLTLAIICWASVMMCNAQQTSQSGVGINTVTPAATLDINGTLRVQNTPEVISTVYILAIDADGQVSKINVSSVMPATLNYSCPDLVSRQSNPYNLTFTSSKPIMNPSNDIIIQGVRFISTSVQVSNNMYTFRYSNVTGRAITNEFSVNFNGQTCNYKL